MTPDIRGPADPQRLAVLLHPHPAYGGNRFHPFIDGLFRQLPEAGVGAVRFDFSSSEPEPARAEVEAAIEVGLARWPNRPVVLAGYSFGAAVAAGVTDDRVAGWYLLAPPLALMEGVGCAGDDRPKLVVVPERDQYSSPAAVQAEVEKWKAASVTVLPGADHFLGDAGAVVTAAAEWIASVGRD